MINAMAINTTKSLDNNWIMLGMEAPSTFLTPISLVRDSTVNVANPKAPDML